MADWRRWGIGSAIGLLVSVGMLSWLLSSYDLQPLIASLQSAHYRYFWPIPLLIFTNFVLRSFRWRVLFTDEMGRPLRSFFRSLMIGYLFNNLMPARAGDLVRVYHLSKSETLSKSKILATLFAERTGDLLALLGLLTMVLLSYPALPLWIKRAGFLVGAGTVGVVCVVVFLRFYGELGLASILRLAAPLIGHRSTRLDEMGRNFLSGLGGLCHVRIGALFFLLTAMLWAFELGVAALIASAFQLEIAAGNLLFVMIAITVGTLVPSSPGYLGTFEFFGLSTLAMVGHTGGNALSFVIVLHAVTILGAGLLGVLCLGRWPGAVALQPAEAQGLQE